MSAQPFMEIEVAYALSDRQLIRKLQVAPGCSALQAVRQAGLEEDFPGVDPERAEMGIFSQPLDGRVRPLPAECILESGDRVELYRPLQIDPKQARLARAAKAKTNRKQK